MQTFPAPTYEQLQAQNDELKKDLQLVKQAVLETLQKAGMYNKDGTMREKPDMKVIMGLLSKLAIPGNAGKEFGYLSDILPLVNKYKDL